MGLAPTRHLQDVRRAWQTYEPSKFGGAVRTQFLVLDDDQTLVVFVNSASMQSAITSEAAVIVAELNESLGEERVTQLEVHVADSATARLAQAFNDLYDETIE